MSLFSHLTFGSNDIARSKAFYDPVMAALGLARLRERDMSLRYGDPERAHPWLTIMRPFDGLPATWGNGTHYSFFAESRAMVHAFHAAALANGGYDEGAPGPRPNYSEGYYAAYVRDPDGNKLQALTYRGEDEVERYDSLLSHVTLGTNDKARARDFYDRLLGALDLVVIDEDEMAWGYGESGTDFPILYAHQTFDGRPASWGNGSHVALLAPSHAAVDEFHAIGLREGAFDEGAPGPRPQYSESYYGAYLRDLDGNKLQAVCHTASQ